VTEAPTKEGIDPVIDVKIRDCALSSQSESVERARARAADGQGGSGGERLGGKPSRYGGGHIDGVPAAGRAAAPGVVEHG